jgi:hypothetical protein
MEDVLSLRQQAREQVQAIGLLRAVYFIAKTGTRHVPNEWLRDWNGLRFVWGSRGGDPDRPYAEVRKLDYTSRHQPGSNPNPTGTVTGTELIYAHEDDGTVSCFRPGGWTGVVVAEAERIKQLPRPDAGAIAGRSEAERFAPFNG